MDTACHPSSSFRELAAIIRTHLEIAVITHDYNVLPILLTGAQGTGKTRFFRYCVELGLAKDIKLNNLNDIGNVTEPIMFLLDEAKSTMKDILLPVIRREGLRHPVVVVMCTRESTTAFGDEFMSGTVHYEFGLLDRHDIVGYLLRHNDMMVNTIYHVQLDRERLTNLLNERVRATFGDLRKVLASTRYNIMETVRVINNTFSPQGVPLPYVAPIPTPIPVPRMVPLPVPRVASPVPPSFHPQSIPVPPFFPPMQPGVLLAPLPVLPVGCWVGHAPGTLLWGHRDEESVIEAEVEWQHNYVDKCVSFSEDEKKVAIQRVKEYLTSVDSIDGNAEGGPKKKREITTQLLHYLATEGYPLMVDDHEFRITVKNKIEEFRSNLWLPELFTLEIKSLIFALTAVRC